MTAVVRIALIVWVLATLVRAGAGAWRRRRLVGAVWRAVTPGAVARAGALVVLVAGIAVALVTTAPGLDRGLGDLVGTTGNVVLTPVEQAAQAAAEAPDRGPRWWLAAGATLFLGGLLALLPWLAFLEEELFRAGLERAGTGRQVAVALVFGAAHLVMLVPLGAAVGVAVAGFVYGRVYRRAYDRAPPWTPADEGLVEARTAYRPTRRARAAARSAATAHPWGVDGVHARQAGAVFASTVLHTTFNAIVIALVWLVVTIGALTGSL